MKRVLAAALVLFSAAASCPAATYTADPAQSSIKFRSDARFGGGLGSFRHFRAGAEVDEAALENSRIEVVIDVASIDTGIAKRDKHLRSEDFFDVARYPAAALSVYSIERSTGGYLARAALTLRGVTKDVALPFTAAPGDAGLRIEGRTVIKRMDFGISYQSRLNPIKDDVEVVYDLLLKK